MASITIVGGNISALVHGGQQQLSCVDQSSSPVTPDSYTTTDATKVSVTLLGLLQGISETGSVTITAIKAGYTSGTITVTCSGGLFSFDPNTATQTNGQNATSITDSAGNTWSATGTAPTVYVNPATGHKAFVLGGAGYMVTTADITLWDGPNVSLFGVFQAGANGTWMNMIDYAATGAGWWFGRSNTNLLTIEVATAYTPLSAGTVNIAAGYVRAGFTIAAAAQKLYLNGSNVGSGTAVFTPGFSTFGAAIGVDSTAEYLTGRVGLILSYNRILTTAEIAQVDLRLANEIVALNALAHTISGSVTTAITVAASPLVHNKHPAISGNVTTHITVAASSMQHSKHPTIAGAITTHVTPASTMLRTHHHTISGNITTAITVAAAAMQHNKHPTLNGSITIHPTPASTMVHTKHPALSGSITIHPTPASTMVYTPAGGTHHTITGSITVHPTPASGMQHNKHPSIAGSITVHPTPASTMVRTHHHTKSGSVTVATTVTGTMHYTPAQKHPTIAGNVVTHVTPAAGMLYTPFVYLPVPQQFAFPTLPSRTSSS